MGELVSILLGVGLSKLFSALMPIINKILISKILYLRRMGHQFRLLEVKSVELLDKIIF